MNRCIRSRNNCHLLSRSISYYRSGVGGVVSSLNITRNATATATTRTTDPNTTAATTRSYSHRTSTSSTAPLQIRRMSDNILGYNPMSNTSPINKNLSNAKNPVESKSDTQKSGQGGPWIGVDSNTEGGGVWAQTNAKRDKLGELRLELRHDLGQLTLDDAATMQEKLDNYLVDGIKAVACFTDDAKEDSSSSAALRGELDQAGQTPALDDFYGLLQEFGDSKQYINRQEYESHLLKLIGHVEQIKAHHTAVAEPSSLISIRDMLAFVPPNETVPSGDKIPSNVEKDISSPILQDFAICSEYYRILLLEACLNYLATKWDDVVKIVDADMDRAAATGTALTVPDTISVFKLHQVLEAFGRRGCSERVRALWDLMDKDGDGLLNQVEMDEVVLMSIRPVENALDSFVRDCMGVWPLRRPIPENPHDFAKEEEEEEMHPEKKGRYQRWKEQRIEKKAKKTFMKLFHRAVKRHFEIDVEVAHRLRCCYAWAEKEHQEGKVNSILVDSSSAVDADGTHHDKTSSVGGNSTGGGGGGLFSGGRKRYVELDPKISYNEFRQVQKGIFPHLDRVSEELCNGFKEELWIIQGKRRQNAVLKRESLAFLIVVSLLDLGITLS